jgi:hypothetical protein
MGKDHAKVGRSGGAMGAGMSVAKRLKNASGSASVSASSQSSGSSLTNGSRDMVLAATQQSQQEEASSDGSGNPVPRQYSISGRMIPTTIVSSNGQQENGSQEPQRRDWSQMLSAGINEAGRLHQIKKFVRESLFPHLKFFVNEDELMWSIEKQSIAQFVVQGLHIPGNEEVRRKWWHNHSSIVLRELNRRRSDVVSMMKKMFMSKCPLYV